MQIRSILASFFKKIPAPNTDFRSMWIVSLEDQIGLGFLIQSSLLIPGTSNSRISYFPGFFWWPSLLIPEVKTPNSRFFFSFTMSILTKSAKNITFFWNTYQFWIVLQCLISFYPPFLEKVWINPSLFV